MIPNCHDPTVMSANCHDPTVMSANCHDPTVMIPNCHDPTVMSPTVMTLINYDLSEMMRLSSTRRFEWESTLKFFVAGSLAGQGGNGDSLSGCVGLICDSCSLFGNGSWTTFFLGSVYAFRRLSPPLSAIGGCGTFWAVALVGTVSN
uniref:Uncharacterized protein n=1 Tax=Ditylenchus dipsaci TaxID=166011 RepID=A0A915DW49_9BILA